MSWTLLGRVDVDGALLEGSAANRLLAGDEAVAATSDGGVLAVGLPGAWPGRVARGQAGAVEEVPGLMPSPGLPWVFTTDGEGLRAVPLSGGAAVEAAAQVGLGEAPTCCGWWEHTAWSGAASAPEAGLLRAVSPPRGGWSLVELLRPGTADPAWRVELTEEPARIAASALSPDGARALVALSDGAGKASLVALDAADGHALWRVSPPGEVHGWRARAGALGVDATRGVLLLDAPSGPALWVFSLEDGRALRQVDLGALTPPPNPRIGLLGDEVWLFEYLPPTASGMSERAEGCVYAAWGLDDGARTRRAERRLGQVFAEGLSDRWKAELASCQVRRILPLGEALGIWTQPAPLSLALYRGPLP
ncbi:MAG: PQQ-binding-like beta-propeller repeat protein [Alphaproteobacteria bacterium]|nr:PQQ-binding-like beta-propeller repeat protein [Alphaproteobacteria bacterium]